MNPYSADMLKTYYSYKALKGLDPNCADYIDNSDLFTSVQPIQQKNSTAEVGTSNENYGSELQYAIIKGLKDRAAEITKSMLLTVPPLEIVNREIIPAFDIVGVGFEKKTIYLPSLLMSAEAAKSAFEVIKTSMTDSNKKTDKGIFVIATVHGDIHDIGKNIVKLLLENYGFNVVDLGKDVPPEVIVAKAV